jgi:hypothetical protein
MTYPEPLPDVAAENDEGHVADHNLIVAAVGSIDERLNDVETAPPGSGVTAHGALTGLADDDHPQYLTQARGDARYELSGFLSGAYGDPPAWAPGQSYPQGATVIHQGMRWRLTAASEPGNGYVQDAFVVRSIQQDFTATGTASVAVAAWGSDIQVGDVVVALVATRTTGGGFNLGSKVTNLTFGERYDRVVSGEYANVGWAWRRVTSTTADATPSITMDPMIAGRVTWVLVRGCDDTPLLSSLGASTLPGDVLNNGQYVVRTAPDSGQIGGFPAKGLMLQAAAMFRTSGTFATSRRFNGLGGGFATWQGLTRTSGLAMDGNNGTVDAGRQFMAGFAQSRNRTGVGQNALTFTSTEWPPSDATSSAGAVGLTLFVQAESALAPNFDTTAWTRLDTTTVGSGDVVDLYPLFPQGANALARANRRNRIDYSDVRHGATAATQTVQLAAPADLSLPGQWIELTTTNTGSIRRVTLPFDSRVATNAPGVGARAVGPTVIFPMFGDQTASTIRFLWDTTHRVWRCVDGWGDVQRHEMLPYPGGVPQTTIPFPIYVSREAANDPAQLALQLAVVNALPAQWLRNMAADKWHFEFVQNSTQSSIGFPVGIVGASGKVVGRMMYSSFAGTAGNTNQGYITAHELGHVIDEVHYRNYANPAAVTAGGVTGSIQGFVSSHPRWIALHDSIKNDPSILAHEAGYYNDSNEFFAELVGMHWQAAAFPASNKLAIALAGLTSDENPTVMDDMLAFLNDLNLLP